MVKKLKELIDEEIVDIYIDGDKLVITTEYFKLQIEVKDGSLSTKVEEYYGDMNTIKKRDHVMTLEEFKESVEDGSIDSCDGHGYYLIGNKITNVEVFSHKDIPTAATGVVWYNK